MALRFNDESKTLAIECRWWVDEEERLDAWNAASLRLGLLLLECSVGSLNSAVTMYSVGRQQRTVSDSSDSWRGQSRG